MCIYVGGSRSSKNHVRVSQPHRLKSCITGIQTATGISGGSEGREVSRVAIEIVSIDGCERRQGRKDGLPGLVQVGSSANILPERLKEREI